MRRRALTASAVLVLLAAGPLAGCSPSGPEPRSDVGVQLFQWTWDAIAAECPALGEAGYGWVLTSPPQEHVLGEQWWTAYQPVSYQVESRLGTREEFSAMTRACHDAGVQVVADAVINHMTGSDSGTGWAGSTFTHYDYPGIWTDADFHHCDAPDGDIANYQDAEQVQTCELVNLADLATEKDEVRARLTDYLEDLLSLGADGFRIDAAKHMAAADVAAILDPLPDDTLVLQEVIHGDGEPIQPSEYLDDAHPDRAVFDFQYAWGLVQSVGSGHLEELLAPRASGLPAASSVLFVTNHDTERNGQTLRYQNGATFELATILMLAGQDGRPMVYSGYAFADRDAGPPQDADGAVLDAACTGQESTSGPYEPGAWVCEHRWARIEAMVGWRVAVGDAPVTDTWTGDRAVAWGRGDRGFIAASGGADLTQTFTTSLPGGTYCDVLSGGLGDSGCEGTPIAVAEDGTVTLTVPAGGAVAIDVDAMAPQG